MIHICSNLQFIAEQFGADPRPHDEIHTVFGKAVRDELESLGFNINDYRFEKHYRDWSPADGQFRRTPPDAFPKFIGYDYLPMMMFSIDWAHEVDLAYGIGCSAVREYLAR